MRTHLKNRTANKVSSHLELLGMALQTPSGEKYRAVFARACDDLNNGRYGSASIEKGVRLARQVIKIDQLLEQQISEEMAQQDAA